MYKQNQLKKIFVTLLSALLIYHSGGFILIYAPASYLIKKVTKELIRKEIIDFDSVKFVFSIEELNSGVSGLQWIHDKEFSYDNKMFDVIKKDTVGDKIVFYCFADTKEDLLEASFEVHFQTGKETRSLDSNSFKITLLSLSEVVIQQTNNLLIGLGSELFFSPTIDKFIFSIHNVPTPPPRFSLS